MNSKQTPLAKRVKQMGETVTRRISRARSASTNTPDTGVWQPQARRTGSNIAAGTSAARGWPVQEYLDAYVEQIADCVQRGQSCVLVGVLGSGKTDVLQMCRAKIEGPQARARVATLDIGHEPQLTPLGLWTHVLSELGAEAQAATLQNAPNAEGAMRAAVRDWLSITRRTLVLMIDQVELLERSEPIFAELRSMVEQQDASATLNPDAGHGGFVIVLASTETLRRDITSPHSPLHNIVHLIEMIDCPSDMRERYWLGVLSGIHVPAPARISLLANLDGLCGGDPYLMRNVAERLQHDIDAAPAGTATDPGKIARQSLVTIQANPGQTAPLLRRYAELVEADREATQVLIALLASGQAERPDGKSVLLDRRQNTTSACVWQGVFAYDKTAKAWRFRNGLTKGYFTREYGRRPDRVARALARHQLFEASTGYLAPSVVPGERGYDRMQMQALRDIMLSWVRTANSLSGAWDIAARAVQLWFGDEATVLRFDARRQGLGGPPPYLQVRVGTIDTPADAAIVRKADWAFKERLADATQDRVALRPVTTIPELGETEFVFPLNNLGQPFGAVVLSDRIHLDIFTPSRSADYTEACTDVLDAVFREIANLDRQLLNNVSLSLVQDLAQKHREPADTDWVLWMMLTAMTADFGLKFNRCALLLASGRDWLHGRCAIGHYRAADWQAGKTPATFDDWLRTYPPNKIPLLARTPMHDDISSVTIEDWHSDPALCRLDQGSDFVELNGTDLAGSALETLMRVEGVAAGTSGPVYLIPIRSEEQLTGVLILDKPFVTEAVTQEHIDLAQSFADQLQITLRVDDFQRQTHLADDLNALTLKPLSLGQTLEHIRALLFKYFPDRITQLVITSWEAHDGSDHGPNRRQSIVRVAHASRAGDLLHGIWQHFFYPDDQACLGPIDEALHCPENKLRIDDLPHWLAEHPVVTGPRFTDGIRSVLSIGLESGTAIPRGVISFQSSRAHAFSSGDEKQLDRLALRVANILEKARVFEGLTRARAHSEQLMRALDSLNNQRTRRDLYRFIVQQGSELFRVETGEHDREHAPDQTSAETNAGPDSAALFLVRDGQLESRVDGTNPEHAERLAHTCTILQHVSCTDNPVFIEYASKELLARERFGEEECDRHATIGAEASAWVCVGDDLLLVLCWTKPRRMNQRERSAMPILAAITARTNGIIDAERQVMREQLATSLRIEDYALIEAEQTHQWQSKFRSVKNNAQWALDDLQTMFDHSPSDERATHTLERLQRILTISGEGEKRLVLGSIKTVEPIVLKTWVQAYVDEWNMLHRLGDGVQCQVETDIPDGTTIRTRPVILRWIINELLNNANEAERMSEQPGPVILSTHMLEATHEIELTFSNPTPIPPEVLGVLSSKHPVQQRDSRGRGVWIVGQQVTNLLGGKFDVPRPPDTSTRFIITLPYLLDQVA